MQRRLLRETVLQDVPRVDSGAADHLKGVRRAHGDSDVDTEGVWSSADSAAVAAGMANGRLIKRIAFRLSGKSA